MRILEGEEIRKEFVRELSMAPNSVRILALLALIRKYILEISPDPQVEQSSQKLAFLFASGAAVLNSPEHDWPTFVSLVNRLKNMLDQAIESKEIA